MTGRNYDVRNRIVGLCGRTVPTILLSASGSACFRFMNIEYLDIATSALGTGPSLLFRRSLRCRHLEFVTAVLTTVRPRRRSHGAACAGTDIRYCLIVFHMITVSILPHCCTRLIAFCRYPLYSEYRVAALPL
jgi:hypothetical protein